MGSTHVDILIILIPLLFSFPGELIGIAYLYRQMGNSMQDMDPESEGAEQLLEDLALDHEAEDEGFLDEGFTSGAWSSAPPPPAQSSAVPAPGATPQVNLYLFPTCPASMLYWCSFSGSGCEQHPGPGQGGLPGRVSGGSEEPDQPGPQQPGRQQHRGHVEGPASLRPAECGVFAAWHQDRLLTGRFRSPKKKAEITPGVESVRRCSIASSASPAQWTDCCCLVESIFVRLCNIHESPSKKGKMDKHLMRWTLILQDYRRIRQLVLANGAVMTSTSMQLVEVNQTTLIQWHNKRVARQDVSLLCQGADLPAPMPVATQGLTSSYCQPCCCSSTTWC